MTRWLSETEQERIQEFAATPEYERSPEMLAPQADDELDEE